MLNKKLVAKKGVDGALEGSIAGALTILIVGVLKQYIKLDGSTEAQLSVALGAVITGAVISLSRMVQNYQKHKKDK